MGQPLSVSGGTRNVDSRGAQLPADPLESPEKVDGDPTTRNILLIGSNGRGKTTVRNFILKSDQFTTHSTKTNPRNIVCAFNEVNGLKIKIYDALTIPDKKLRRHEAEAYITARLKDCFDECKEGFHVIIFVFSHTKDVTSEESVAAEILINFFGRPFLRKQAIAVFTHAETLDKQSKARSSGGPNLNTRHRQADVPLLRNLSQNCKQVFQFSATQSPRMASRKEAILQAISTCSITRDMHGYKTMVQKSDRSGNHTVRHHSRRSASDPTEISKSHSATHRDDPGDTTKRNILLVGSSGRGKSSVGNFILGSDLFTTSDSMDADFSWNIDCQSKEVDGLKITICDALTITDKRLLRYEAEAYVNARLQDCFAQCPEGFHFIIFVFSHTNRVTPEEHVAVEILMKVFGERFLWDQAIVVFTHGESFDIQRKAVGGPDFDTWYRKAEEPLLQRFSKYTKAFQIHKTQSQLMTTQRVAILRAIQESSVIRDKYGLTTMAQESDRSSASAAIGNRNIGYDQIGGAPQNYFHGSSGLDTDPPNYYSATKTDVSHVSCDVELFLLGKTGSGKSKTGNTILGRNKFAVSDMSQSVTLDTAAGWTERNGLTIKVVDGPGLLDTRLAGQAQLEQMKKNVSAGFVHCPNGFHALVLVLKYGNRFTDEEKKVVTLLKGIFGDDFTQKHCILLFTDGENFLLQNPNGNFLDWCKKQRGDLRTLIDECGGRVVLFHNMTPAKSNDSTSQLISLARNLSGRYTAEIFHRISIERSNFIRKQGAIQLKELIQAKIDLIINFLEKGQTGTPLKQTVDRLEEEINKENPRLKVVHDVKQGIQQTRTGKYQSALKTFKNIEYEGQIMLVSIYELLLIALVHIFESFLYLFV